MAGAAVASAIMGVLLAGQTRVRQLSFGSSRVRVTHEFSRLWLSAAFIVKKFLNILDRLERS
jgi:hypothetical protein